MNKMGRAIKQDDELPVQQVVETAKHTFRRLLNDNAHESIIELLVSLRSKIPLSANDVGWVLWNVCDRYAVLRDAKNQYSYQSEFHEWIKSNLPPSQLHWVVSDSTQALTLINGGFLDFWWHCYQFANENSPIVAANRPARFESHRANASAYTYFREFGRAETAFQSIENLLLEDPTWTNHDFATVTFSTLLIDFYNAQNQSERVFKIGEDVVLYLDEWLSRYQRSEIMIEKPLLGSWDQLNEDRSPEAIFIAIHNAACALTRAKQFSGAERLFRICLNERPNLTSYSEALYLVTCWENRHSKNEIRDLLHEFKRVTPQHLLRLAPELIAALEGNTGNG